MAPEMTSDEAATLSPLGSATLPGPAPGPSPAIWFKGRMFLAAANRILWADGESGAWTPVYEIKPRKLEPALGDTAEQLGIVKDGPAAAAMGTEIPGGFGIGPLTVLQAPTDRAPCLYAVTRSLWGGQILRSIDGKRFEPVRGPDGLGTSSRIALAGLAVAGDWLATAPAPVEVPGKAARLPAGEVTIYARKGHDRSWQAVSAPGFGANVFGGVTGLIGANGRIHAAVEDVHRGFQLWSATPGDDLPWAWTRVIERGAWRYSLAPRVTAMAEFGGALYLGAAISETGFGVDRAGPAAAELLRVRPDGGWDVMVGAPRFSPDGFKVPLSGTGPGFGDPFATAILDLTEVGGVLYAATRNIQAEYRLNAKDGASAPPRRDGARIWASSDGEDWQALPIAGHGDPSVTAIRAVCAGPSGLCVAAARNHAVAALTAEPPRAVYDDDFAKETLQIWG